MAEFLDFAESFSIVHVFFFYNVNSTSVGLFYRVPGGLRLASLSTIGH